MIPPTICSTRIATIGLTSIGPIGGMKRRKIERYGSQTSRRKPSTALDQFEYGTRPPNEKISCVRMYAKMISV